MGRKESNQTNQTWRTSIGVSAKRHLNVRTRPLENHRNIVGFFKLNWLGSPGKSQSYQANIPWLGSIGLSANAI